MKRIVQVGLFLALLAALALRLPGEAQAQAYNWSTVTVDGPDEVRGHTSIAVGANGDPMISYYDATNDDLKFAVCDMSASTNGNCDQTDDWSTVTVDSEGNVGGWLSMAVGGSGDPMISYQLYRDDNDSDLKFAICDMSGSTNGNCDQTDDWSTVTVDGRFWAVYTSIAVDGNGDPMISYFSGGLMFAMCDMSASTNGNCDQTGDWSTGLGTGADGGRWTSIAVNSDGDPMISHEIPPTGDLRFSICDVSASTNGNCDQTGEWSTVTVDSEGSGVQSSIGVDSNGDPMISYPSANLMFAICDLSASTNGNCDQAEDWSTVTVESGEALPWATSIAVTPN